WGKRASANGRSGTTSFVTTAARSSKGAIRCGFPARRSSCGAKALTCRSKACCSRLRGASERAAELASHAGPTAMQHPMSIDSMTLVRQQTPLLQVASLTKRYGEERVLDDVSFSAHAAEVLG